MSDAHGIKRVTQTPEVIAARKLKEQGKIAEFLALTDDILSRKKAKDWSEDALALTTKLLHLNPQFYTVWNYRRNIFLNGIFPGSSKETINDVLLGDLAMTMGSLKSHPKVYWIWNHRRWCLENVPEGPGSEADGDHQGWRKANWDKELFVVERMLEADARNFLAWDYRRYILANMPVARPKKAELAYTTRKIEANFSNFSAWHQRSKILSTLWETGELDPDSSKESEFDLVRNAMYTDPEDQSVWIYHRWLVGSAASDDLLFREIDAIRELWEQEPTSKWCMEAILHYKRLLLRKERPATDRSKLVEECRQLLNQLEKIDPLRRNRYGEILRNL